LTVSEKDLADLAFAGLHFYSKEKLEGFDFLCINCLQMKAIGSKFKLKNAKYTYKTHRSNTHVVDHDSDNSGGEEKEVYSAEFAWQSNPKPCTCPSVKLTQKNWQDKVKFTFDVSKYDHIFDELFKNGSIRLSHAIPSAKDLKRHAYCKLHNNFSHATNNCNVFCRQVQSAINEGRLLLAEIQVDKAPFPVHTLDQKQCQSAHSARTSRRGQREQCDRWRAKTEGC